MAAAGSKSAREEGALTVQFLKGVENVERNLERLLLSEILYYLRLWTPLSPRTFQAFKARTVTLHLVPLP